MTPDEVVAFKAEHELHRASPNTGLCTITMGGGEHCLPYLLAVEVERLAGKVARVKALMDEWAEHSQIVEGGTIISTPFASQQIRAALADHPEHDG